jgi:hypothetical protein
MSGNAAVGLIEHSALKQKTEDGRGHLFEYETCQLCEPR